MIGIVHTSHFLFSDRCTGWFNPPVLVRTAAPFFRDSSRISHESKSTVRKPSPQLLSIVFTGNLVHFSIEFQGGGNDLFFSPRFLPHIRFEAQRYPHALFPAINCIGTCPSGNVGLQSQAIKAAITPPKGCLGMSCLPHTP